MNTTRYRRHSDILLTALEGEGVVLHLEGKRYFSVNETGLALLEALAQPRSVPELVQVLLDAYDVSEETARETAREFLDQCLTSAVVVEAA